MNTIAESLGARKRAPTHRLAIFVPSHDCQGTPVPQADYVALVARTLVEAAGGVTILPAARGGWFDPATGSIVWEHPIIVYTNIDASRLVASLPAIRNVLHTMGRETNQGEVGLEFDGEYFAITDYDVANKEGKAA